MENTAGAYLMTAKRLPYRDMYHLRTLTILRKCILMDYITALLQLITILILLDKKQNERRRVFPQQVRTTAYKNLGEVKPIPEVDRDLEKRMCEYYLHGGDLNFTQAFIVQKFGASQDQALNIKAKWERDGILSRVNGSARNSPHRLTSMIKLRRL